MENDNGLLSQEEVDALFKQATGKSVNRSPAIEPGLPPASVPTAATPAPARAVAAPPVPPTANPVSVDKPIMAPPTVKNTSLPPPPPNPKPQTNPAQVRVFAGSEQGEIKDYLNRISERLDTLENRLDRLGKSGMGRQVQNDTAYQSKIERLSTQLKTVTAELRAIQSGLQNTPDFNLRAEFVCDECGTQGAITTRHRCSKCGGEGWWGWWPENNQD